MSQVYVKRCNKCGKVAVSPNVPNPAGWQCLADMVHGTLASFDLCPGCQSAMGIKDMLAQSVRDRASTALKSAMNREELDAITVEALEVRVQAGEFDAAFESGDGIDLFDTGTGMIHVQIEEAAEDRDSEIAEAVIV